MSDIESEETEYYQEIALEELPKLIWKIFKFPIFEPDQGYKCNFHHFFLLHGEMRMLTNEMNNICVLIENSGKEHS